MTSLEQITQMRQQGKTDADIITALQQQGVPEKEISDSLAQSRIKAAVAEPQQNQPQNSFTPQTSPQNNQIPSQNPSQGQPSQIPNPPQSIQVPEAPQPATQEYKGMEQSIMDSPGGQTAASPSLIQDQYPPAEENYQTDQGYYEPRQSSLSSDTISEISEQIVTEKMSEIKKHLHKIVNFKTTAETWH